MSEQPSPDQPARRRLLAGAAGLGVLGAALALPARAQGAARMPLALTAQTTEGPYYFDPGLVRADITEGLSGVPLEVRFTVLDQAGVPYAGARVDIWHCDASGLYSGYAGQGDDRKVSTRGKTFLRGSLTTGADGVAAFRSVYPGWYEGRTTHIHFKVLNGTRAVLTSQFFLPDALSEYLYTQLPAYKRARVRGTLNSNDGIALSAGGSVLGSVREDTGRYVASLNVVVDRNANPLIDRPAQPGAMPPGARQRQGNAGGRPPQMAGGSPTFTGGPPRELGNGPAPGFAGAPPPGAFGHEATLEGAARIAALVPGFK